MTLRILFVCSKNKLRSPTAADVFAEYDEIETMSAGTNKDALTPISGDLIEWADLILVMEKCHKYKIFQKFKEVLRNKKIGVLDIRDNYDYMQPELVLLLKNRVGRHVNTADIRQKEEK